MVLLLLKCFCLIGRFCQSGVFVFFGRFCSQAAASSLAEKYVGARELDKLERGKDAAEFSATKKRMAEEAHRALGTMVVQAKGASAAAAASRYDKGVVNAMLHAQN